MTVPRLQLVAYVAPDPERLAWQAHGACAGTDVDFFPERGESLAAARAICARCQVSDECLTYALDLGITHGVWGGTSERDRRALRKARRAVPA